jgi:non-heme chloroperoxidase
MDTYADDLAAVIEALDLRDVVLVGHSTGGGEVTRYMGRHGTSRVAKAVLVGAIPPLMLRTNSNPGGQPIEVFDGLRAGVAHDRAQSYKGLSESFYGANRPASRVSQGINDTFWLWSMQVGIKGAYDCIKVFSETDLTDDLRKIDVPTLIIHGDDVNDPGRSLRLALRVLGMAALLASCAGRAHHRSRPVSPTTGSARAITFVEEVACRPKRLMRPAIRS